MVILEGHGRRTETVATAMKLTGKNASVQLLIINKKMMAQTVRSKSSTTSSVYEINSIGPSTEPCGTLQQTVKGPLRSSQDFIVEPRGRKLILVLSKC